MKGLIFTYLLTYGGAIASLLEPYVGLLIYVCFALLSPESMWFWSVPAGNYSRIVAVAMLTGWAAHGFGKWNFGRASLPVYALIAWFGWGVVSALLAPNQEIAWTWVEGKFKIVLPFVMGMTIIRSTRQLRQIAWVIVGTLGYVAYDLNISYWAGFNRLVLMKYAGMDNNTFSTAMVAGTAAAYFLGISETVMWRRWLAFVCAALMFHVPMFTDSRGGMIGLMVVGIMAFVLTTKQPKHYFAFALAVIIALRLAGPGVWARFETIFAPEDQRDDSAESRLILWGQCRECMMLEPIFGIGPRHFPKYAAASGLWDKSEKEAHSLWLQTGAELGFPGMIFLSTFYGGIVIRMWQLRRSTDPDDAWSRDMAGLVLTSIVGFAVTASFVTVEGVEPPYYIAMLGAGLLKLKSMRSATQEPEWSAGRSAPAPVSGAAC
ncbi:MAG: O-antigen ligase family protein [Planctomycetes bacterium]|nr:O-antigen ligase family protein [Planctomycetota bacterium]